MNLTYRHLLVGLGCVLLMIGTFAPFVTIPFVGGTSYFGIAPGEALLLFVLGFLALGLTAADRMLRLVPYLGLVSLLLVLWALARFQIGRDDFERGQQVARRDAFSSVADNSLGLARLSWGAGLLIVGSAVMLVSGSANPSRRQVHQTVSARCTACGNSSANETRSFFGFVVAQCGSCNARTTRPLSSSFRVAYWILASLTALHGAWVVTAGVPPVAWLFTLVVAVPLVKDASLRRA